jgi:pyruvate-ferredoxin/flavodoxin oxidoreductase
MSSPRRAMIDGNEAAASVAYRVNETIAIYPITPSSAMAESCDEWAAAGKKNIYGAVPDVVEMQSEAGAAGVLHGALTAGALATTFTASQGLLLMIPNLYKIAGELTPCCIHVAARTVATHALSIFGDHSDVLACRQTGWAMLVAGDPQEAHDFAAIGHAASLRARVPFLHFFDGFRTSHEIRRVTLLSDDDLREIVGRDARELHRLRGLSPDRPSVRGTAQNPDVFFQAREAATPFYARTPSLVRETMDRFAELTGRRYELFEYRGHPEAEHVIVVMGSGAETAAEEACREAALGRKVGVVKVNLYRPFCESSFLAALPAAVKTIAVLDRTKEPGAPGEPLYLDVVAALHAAPPPWDARRPRVIGGRFGLSSKEFTPAMVRAVVAAAAEPEPRRGFTVGIVDDVSGTSLPVADRADDLDPGFLRAVFYGLGADGTVGANKNSVKIVGEATDLHAQAYFVYDSKKSGAVTVSHLRFAREEIRAPYLIRRANFVACHQFGLLDRLDILASAEPGATVLLNAPGPTEEVFANLPREMQDDVLSRGLRLYAVDAQKVAREAGLGGRINTVMQACFFALADVMPREAALEKIRDAARKTYKKRGEETVLRNVAAIDAACDALRLVPLPTDVGSGRARTGPAIDADAPDFVKRVTAAMLEGRGDLLPVSAFPPDGRWPTGTSRFEKRGIATEIPVWDRDLCIQCNKCALYCPHAAIRAKAYPTAALAHAPAGFAATPYRGREFADASYTIQVSPEDCTGCRLCVAVCPAVAPGEDGRRALAMAPEAPLRAVEAERFEFFLDLPDPDRAAFAKIDVKASQFLRPLFEFSGACAGCGETPYVKLLTQLYGDRLLVANATGCSSIFGGNLPTTPYCKNDEGRGPAWANSLFEDNAEFGLGFRLAVDRRRETAEAALVAHSAELGEEFVREILGADQATEAGVAAQRARVAELRRRLGARTDAAARALCELADDLVKKTVWLVGGDGWAYDIGFGGLDHVLAGGRKVNVLVLDTEVYSNTGGQQSKATPLGASARFAAAGKTAAKKDLGLIAMTYGNVYVASVALGAKDAQTVQALQEAESYPGASLVIAYSPCIAHGYDLADGAAHEKNAVASGYWPLYRYDPRRAERGEAPLIFDAPPPRGDVAEFMAAESRFRALEAAEPERYRELTEAARRGAERRAAFYRLLGSWKPSPSST